MNFKETTDSILHCMLTLKDAWPVKLAASFFISMLTTLTGFFASEVGTILFLFFALVLFDLFARWLAMAKQYLDDTGAEQSSLWVCFISIGKAYRAGYIKRDIMKHRFAGKFLWYLIMCVLALALYTNFFIFSNAGSFVKLFVIYIVISEAMSVLENLQQAGSEQAKKLLAIIKNKRQVLK